MLLSHFWGPLLATLLTTNIIGDATLLTTILKGSVPFSLRNQNTINCELKGSDSFTLSMQSNLDAVKGSDPFNLPRAIFIASSRVSGDGFGCFVYRGIDLLTLFQYGSVEFTLNAEKVPEGILFKHLVG